MILPKSVINMVSNTVGKAAALVGKAAGSGVPSPLSLVTGNMDGLAKDLVRIGANALELANKLLDKLFKTEPEPPTPKCDGTKDPTSSKLSPEELEKRMKEFLDKFIADIQLGHTHKTGGDTTTGTSGNAPTTAATTATTTGAGKSDGSNNVSDPNAKAFLALSPDELFKRVMAGDIPDAVKNDPAAMMGLQTKMQEISRAMQLLTNLLQATHETQMALIRNVRA